MTTIIRREQVLDQPSEVAAAVERHLANTAARVVHHDSGCAVFEMTLQPSLELVADDYPVEVVRISQFRDVRHPVPYAIPLGPSRPWLHRYPLDLDLGSYGQLCLWHPDDPGRLVWSWTRGFVDFVAITQRHLWFEEFHRREGYWPAEDAPHGQQTADNHLPPASPKPAMRRAA